MTKTPALPAKVVKEYVASLGLPSDAHYWGGAPLRPLPPLDTTIGGFMIVGAIRRRDCGRWARSGSSSRGQPRPVEPERYFDGDRVRTLRSADELRDLHLRPLGLNRIRCWIIDLVRVFRFKPGHRNKCQ